MKRLFWLTLMIINIHASAQPFKTMTCNIRYDNPDDGDDRWELRRDGLIGLIKKSDADIIGFQEVLHSQLADLEKGLKGYEHFGVGRDDGKEEGEYSPLFVKSKRFKSLDQGNFWLSATTEMPGKGWDAACNRICTWSLLKDNSTKRVILVMNTHLDHQGKIARQKSVQLLLLFIEKKIEEYINGLEEGSESGLEVILMGDFNFTPEDPNYQSLVNSGNAGREGLTDVFVTAPLTADGTVGTYNGFNLEEPPVERIDYVWTTGINIRSCRHISTKLASGRWPSDHLPVLVEMEHSE
ncbi:MAG: endonuclease/exonuclease/phosphatase family protein [Bacteroidota bacterium]